MLLVQRNHSQTPMSRRSVWNVTFRLEHKYDTMQPAEAEHRKCHRMLCDYLPLHYAKEVWRESHPQGARWRRRQRWKCLRTDCTKIRAMRILR